MAIDNPHPSAIREARRAAGLTQTQAADLVCTKLRSWQQWEAGDRRMHPGLWRLFGMLTAQAPDSSAPMAPR